MWLKGISETGEKRREMNKKTIFIIIKLIPIVSAVLSFILVFSKAHADSVTTVSVILAFLGFLFFFIGRRYAKEDKTLKILGVLDLLATVSIIVLYAFVFIAIARGVTDTGDVEDDSTQYAVEDMEIGTGIGSFKSIDLDGNEISDEIFSEKDVTVLNVWATFCDPCKEEMPELQKMAEELPDNAQVIGVVMDAPPQGADRDGEYDVWEGDPYNIQTAREICGETGVKYTNILASDSVFKAFKNVEAVPTTFILDKSGNMVCKAFVGADVQGYRKAVNDYLSGL